MNQLITITQNENNDQVVSGRELHMDWGGDETISIIISTKRFRSGKN